MIKSKKKLKNLGRRINRFFKKPKFLKIKKELLQFYKYSLIYSVGNSEIHLNRDEGIVHLFKMCVTAAWNFFMKLGRLFIKFFKKSGTFLAKNWMTHRWFVAYVVFASCALLILQRLARKFGRKLNWYHVGGLIILCLGIIGGFAGLIKMEAFKTIGEWIKSILLALLIVLKNLTSFLNKLLNKHSADLEPISGLKPSHDLEPKPSKAGEFKTFVFFSILTVLTTRFLLIRFKRKLVGESPLTDIMIEILDYDIPDFADFLRVN